MTDAAAARRAFLDAVAMGEDYDLGDYDELVGGRRFAGYDDFPVWEGVRFASGISHAAGRYQFEPETWRAQAVKLGLVDFSPASQDRAAWDLAVTVYHARTGQVLPDDLLADRLDRVGPALHSTWTSLSAATFPARYRRALALEMPAPPLPSVRDLVRQLQERLAAAGFYDGAIDGLCGPLTSAAALEAVDS